MEYLKLPVYIHIPYCSQLCHYCDFAKTSNWDDTIVSTYFEKLESHAEYWVNNLGKSKVSSLFLGGGTPSLFTHHYQRLFEILSPVLAKDAEITIEANPGNLTFERLKFWRSLGINRLSVGVQSFNCDNLRFLVRDHSATDAREALVRACQIFENCNIDLIYGIPGQTIDSFLEDLRLAEAYGVKHLSLYNLTFEQSTPIGRAYHRGRIIDEDIENEFRFYKGARTFLAEKDFQHDEVSNWSRDGYSCKHNWAYWMMSPYVAIGAGAHGFLRSDERDIGTRYHYGKNDRFLSFYKSSVKTTDYSEFLRSTNANVEPRVAEHLLIEYVATALRTRVGVPVAHLEKVTNKLFTPTKKLVKAMNSGRVAWDEDSGHLKFHPDFWFFENQWGVEVVNSFT